MIRSLSLIVSQAASLSRREVSLVISRRKLKPGGGVDNSNGSVEIRATWQHVDDDEEDEDGRDNDFEKERGCDCECESRSEGLERKEKRKRW